MRLCTSCGVGLVAVRYKYSDEPQCVDCARSQTIADLRPLISPPGDRVVILPDKTEGDDFSRYRGLLVIPPNARTKTEFGTGVVLAVGPGAIEHKRLSDRFFPGTDGTAKRSPMYSKPGDHIIWRQKHEGVVHKWRGLVICHDFDVLAEIEEEDERQEVQQCAQ